jgi:ATP-binding cassette subfamily C protein LapB
MTIGSLIAANMLSSRVLGPFNQQVGSWRTYAQFRQSVARLSDIFDLKKERQETGIALERPLGDITLDHVVFKYGEESAPVMENLRLKIKLHSLVAIMDPNGSGKTTLIKLIQGLYQPSDGRVLLDDADVSQFTRNGIAAWMGYVPQELFLFTGSIRDNIAKGAPEATDDDILKASRMAGLHDFVIDYFDGYATDIGEAGRRMPGGLRQRITIARAYLRDPPILLMDEPSSNLDREGEAGLCVTLKEMAKDHTIVVVTHSAAILAASDQVLIMQKGRVVRASRPQDVLPQLVATHGQQAQPRPPEAPLQKPQELPKKPRPIQKQSAWAGPRASSRESSAIAGAVRGTTPTGSTIWFGATRCLRCGRWRGSS